MKVLDKDKQVEFVLMDAAKMNSRVEHDLVLFTEGVL